ncbi:MAG: hypothetical protein MJD61_01625, partial [Proteobacteria bacterium]|nr:hypothetical protein [Pseudomonadota bacterium]
MSKPKLVLYSQELKNCSCFRTLFNTAFQAEPAETEDTFLHRVQEGKADAAVVCCCSAREQDAEELLRIEALAGPLPVLI